jgi:hypothetical protein
MSYNPVRALPHVVARRQPSLTDGVKHSDILKRKGIYVAANAIPEKTAFGVHYKVFEGKKLLVRNEVMSPSNHTGMGSNAKGERYIILLSGTLYAIIEEKGEQTTRKLSTGMNAGFTPGTKYALATDGINDAEFTVIETTGYAKGWKRTTDQVSKPGEITVSTAGTKNIPVLQRDSSIEKRNAERFAADRKRRESTSAPKGSHNMGSGSVSFGTNLRPVGASNLADD